MTTKKFQPRFRLDSGNTPLLDGELLINKDGEQILNWDGVLYPIHAIHPLASINDLNLLSPTRRSRHRLYLVDSSLFRWRGTTTGQLTDWALLNPCVAGEYYSKVEVDAKMEELWNYVKENCKPCKCGDCGGCKHFNRCSGCQVCLDCGTCVCPPPCPCTNICPGCNQCFDCGVCACITVCPAPGYVFPTGRLPQNYNGGEWNTGGLFIYDAGDSGLGWTSRSEPCTPVGNTAEYYEFAQSVRFTAVKTTDTGYFPIRWRIPRWNMPYWRYQGVTGSVIKTSAVDCVHIMSGVDSGAGIVNPMSIRRARFKNKELTQNVEVDVIVTKNPMSPSYSLAVGSDTFTFAPDDLSSGMDQVYLI